MTGSDSSSPLEPPRPRRAAGLRLRALAAELGAVVHAGDTEPTETEATDPVLTGVTLDSRSVQRGDLWAALPGANAHGAQFAGQAAQQGAAAALTDEAGADRCRAAGLTALVVDDPRAATARAAACVFGHPAHGLATIGVTGTNGKTSVTTMVHGTLLELGVASGVVGTSGTAYRGADGAGHEIGTVRTTPEAPELHGILARMREDAVAVCGMEISSHALVLHRADEVVCTVACFTNLSQDHLDFHADMEDYFRAKARLFTPQHSRRGIICVDDEWGRRLADLATVPVTTYATRPDVIADVRVTAVEPTGFGTDFTVVAPDGEHRLHAALPGMHYVANTVAAWLLLDAVGQRGPAVDAALARAGTVPGRMELVTDGPVRGVVDYSHTPDALQKALETIRAVPDTRRLLAVIGAGGDRDRTKRPVMGAVAARGADVVIVTDDNPRSEDPAAIRQAVAAGVPADTSCELHVVAGRAEAIALAAELAAPGDTVLVAGKGAETGQDIGGIVHPFDDRVRLRDALAAARPLSAQEDI